MLECTQSCWISPQKHRKWTKIDIGFHQNEKFLPCKGKRHAPEWEKRLRNCASEKGFNTRMGNKLNSAVTKNSETVEMSRYFSKLCTNGQKVHDKKLSINNHQGSVS